jgi:DNA-directed RNA polymerase specialized sigma24 family protein
VNGASALCEDEGDALRRALTVAFADEPLAARCTAVAFARARRRWRALATQPDPMAWVDVTAVRAARRKLTRAERPRPPVEHLDEERGGPLAALSARARVAVVLHALRGRSPDEIADALATSTDEVDVLLREAYRSLGVIDVVIADDVAPYAG